MSSPTGLRELIGSELSRLGVRRDGLRGPLSEGGPATPAAVARVTTSAWLVEYRAATNTLPANSDPAWTEHKTGSAAQSVTSDLLTITSGATPDSLYNIIDLSGLDSSKGSLVEASLCVTTDAASINGGACLSVFDGQYLSVVWLRTDGLNIDGSPDVPVTLSDAQHRVALAVRGNEVRVHVDGALLQTGAPASSTTLEAIAFGSWIDSTP